MYDLQGAVENIFHTHPILFILREFIYLDFLGMVIDGSVLRGNVLERQL